MITEKDKKLIARAQKLPAIFWYRAELLASETDTQEAEETLLQIARRLHHLEESHEGYV